MYLILEDETYLRVRKSFFLFRAKLNIASDSIVCIKNRDSDGQNLNHDVIKDLLLLEGEYRLKHNAWDNSPTSLRTIDIRKRTP